MRWLESRHARLTWALSGLVGGCDRRWSTASVARRIAAGGAMPRGADARGRQTGLLCGRKILDYTTRSIDRVHRGVDMSLDTMRIVFRISVLHRDSRPTNPSSKSHSALRKAAGPFVAR